MEMKNGQEHSPHERTEGLAARLRQTIEGYGRVTAAASAIGRSEGALRKWMRGESEPNASDLRRLAELTGVSVEWLVFGQPAPSSRAILMSYIAHSIYREVCQKAHLAETRWGGLSPAERGRYERFAEGRIASWLAMASLPQESRSE